MVAMEATRRTGNSHNTTHVGCWSLMMLAVLLCFSGDSRTFGAESRRIVTGHHEQPTTSDSQLVYDDVQRRHVMANNNVASSGSGSATSTSTAAHSGGGLLDDAASRGRFLAEGDDTANAFMECSSYSTYFHDLFNPPSTTSAWETGNLHSQGRTTLGVLPC
eukprot:169573-Pyramimonas_sp.AAC.1